MSCDDHHVDCDEVLQRLDVFLDHELTDRVLTYAEIEAHLGECQPCLSEYDLERVVKEVLARSCPCEHAPDELRTRVLARIREVRVQITEIT